MKNASISKSSQIIKIALGTAIILIIYICFVFFTQMQNLGNSVDAMTASNKRLFELEKVLFALTSNESSVRTFIITGDREYLKKRFYKKSAIQPQLDRLAKSGVNAGQNFSADTLQKLVNLRYDLFDECLYAAINVDSKDPQIKFLLVKGDKLSEKIREYIYSSLENEATNVNHYAIDHRYEIQTSIITSFLLVTIALFILLLSFGRMKTDLSSVKSLNDELQFMNYNFNNAEKIAGISHWKYMIQSKKYSFSENFYNLLGVNPDTFEPTIENIVSFLHPEDRDNVVRWLTDSPVNKKPKSLVFRLYRRNGDMRYLKSIATFTKNSNGEIVRIGVNYDITEHYLNTLNLEESNRHLLAINDELESFNNIVSHDLQEPLRKIQMFISRINHDDLDNLSPTARDYFDRITASANRMQNLMIDLVNYSRTIKGDKVLVKTDLNKIIGEVLSELAINIDESHAILTIGPMPVINTIPFQIRQLFINLISNALKFVAPGRVPQIKVSRQKLTVGETFEGTVFDDRLYYKIVVSDNGIGFKQEFADKIFELFGRLEKQSDYSGTGIGLAICKKIVENHNGYIFAEGELGKGAKFIILLPK